MTKYPTSRKRFGRQFKQRHFRLTTHSLSYAKSKGKQPICDIPLQEIASVEQLKDKSFKMQNCFKVSIHSMCFDFNWFGCDLHVLQRIMHTRAVVCRKRAIHATSINRQPKPTHLRAVMVI